MKTFRKYLYLFFLGGILALGSCEKCVNCKVHKVEEDFYLPGYTTTSDYADQLCGGDIDRIGNKTTTKYTFSGTAQITYTCQ